MEIILFLFGTIARLILRVYMMLLLIRALLPFLSFIDEESAVAEFIYTSTEPVLSPMRTVFDKYGIGAGVPVDISFLATYIILSIVHTLLTYL